MQQQHKKKETKKMILTIISSVISLIVIAGIILPFSEFHPTVLQRKNKEQQEEIEIIKRELYKLNLRIIKLERGK